MPHGVYKHIPCTGVQDKKFEPTQHQVDTMNFFLNSPYKGLLLYHKLGSGKTCTSIMIADTMLERKMIEKVYILTPGSLRQGWINEYCKICGKPGNNMPLYYTYVTYNYDRKNMGGIPDFNNSLVIIDEVHNLINSVKNMSKRATQFYNALYEQKCKILALSGTPISNYVYEFALLGRLLKPGDNFFPDIRKGDKIDDYPFMDNFNIDEAGNLKPINETRIKRLLEGIISYYPGAGKEFVPEIFEQPPIKMEMSGLQEAHYWQQEIQERKLSFPPNAGLAKQNPERYQLVKKLYIMARKNILTRRASNFYYPQIFLPVITEVTKEDGTIEEKQVLVPTSQLRDLPIFRPGGWITPEYFEKGQILTTYSPKFTAFFVNVKLHDKQKHVLFTFFKNKSGVILLHSLLKMCGITSEIFSGDLNDMDRNKILRNFNADDNKYGDKIRVLLVTEAGAEGISVLTARHMHILESSPRMSKTIQAIGRVARFLSHHKLPVEERNIKVWRYWSIATKAPISLTLRYYDENGNERSEVTTIHNKECIDEILYRRGMKTIRGIESFLDILKQHSVTSFIEPKKEKGIINI